jgi:hypothetical protein
MNRWGYTSADLEAWHSALLHNTAQNDIPVDLITWVELHCCELGGLKQGGQAHVPYLQGVQERNRERG